MTSDEMKDAGIALDDWKLPIFKRHLKTHGYKFTNHGELAKGMLLLKVKTTNLEALLHVIEAAQLECAKKGTKQ